MLGIPAKVHDLGRQKVENKKWLGGPPYVGDRALVHYGGERFPHCPFYHRREM